MDKIFLKNLRLKTRIGLFDWEKQIDQIINIDLEAGFDILKAAKTDTMTELSYFSDSWGTTNRDINNELINVNKIIIYFFIVIYLFFYLILIIFQTL